MTKKEAVKEEERNETLKGETSLDLSIAPLDTEWDGDQAKMDMRIYSSPHPHDLDNMDWDKYAEGFFYCDESEKEKASSYKLPFALLMDGELVAVPQGIFSAAAAVQGARGGVELPEEAREEVKEKIAAYYSRMDREAPFVKHQGSLIPNIKELKKIDPEFVSGSGPEDAQIVFVAASPSALEVIRESPLVGPTGKIFNDVFLKSLDVDRSRVRILYAVPIHLKDEDGKDRSPTAKEFEIWRPWVDAQIEKHETVIALGKISKTLIGDAATFALPHPRALLLFGNSGEVDRKTRAIKKQLSENKIAKSVKLNIVKANDDKKLVYGIVLEPDTTDLQMDVIDKNEIETAAHEFMKSFRVVGDNHNAIAKASVVESYIAPTDGEMNGKPYTAGSWIMAVKVDDDQMWEALKGGDYTGFSIGGSAERVGL